jgi:chemotaxis protein CheD
MPDADIAPLDVYVQPGESHLVREPAILRTVLGSCVGVTFWSPNLGVAALCHPMMPRQPRGRNTAMNIEAARRYVDFAIRDLARQLDALGAVRADVEVKMFGGADVLPVTVCKHARPTIGKMNCEVAIEVLRAEGFHVAAARIRGACGLSLQFHTATGAVLLRPLS